MFVSTPDFEISRHMHDICVSHVGSHMGNIEQIFKLEINLEDVDITLGSLKSVLYDWNQQTQQDEMKKVYLDTGSRFFSS